MNFKRLEDKIEWVFIFCLCVSSLTGLVIYSLLLKTVFAINTSMGNMIYIYAALLIILFSIYLYFQVQKFKSGKKIKIVVQYFHVEVVGTLVLAISLYSVIAIGKYASIFELLNIRLMLSFLLIFLNPTIAIFTFEFFRRRIYKNRYIKELDIPISYKVIPATMSAVIIALSLIRGIHYKAELKVSNEYNHMNIIKNTSSIAYNTHDILDDVLNKSDAILEIIKAFVKNSNVKTIDRYENVIGNYIIDLLSSTTGVETCSIFFENDNRINEKSLGGSIFTTIKIRSKTIFSLSNIHNPIENRIYEKITNEKKTVAYVDNNSEHQFLIYSPIIIDDEYIGFLFIGLSKYFFDEILSNSYIETITTVIVDENYNIGYSSNEDDIEFIYNKLNDDKQWNIVKESEFENISSSKFRYSNLIKIDDDKCNIIKWSLPDNIIVLNIWKDKGNISDFIFYKTVIYSTIINIACVVFIFIFLVFLLRTIIDAISKAKSVAESVGKGAGDLTLRLPVDRNDEVGELLNAFNMFLDKINTIIESIKNNAYLLTGNVQNMQSSILTTLNDFKSIQDEFATEIETAKKISDTSSNAAHVSYLQRSKFITVNNTIQSLLDNISIINSHMRDQSEAVEKTSSSIHEMMSNIVTVGQGANKANNYAKNLYTEAYDGSVIGSEVMESIQNIREYSKQIINITHVINNIAEQTNLLAMNAAIEAVHAREHGRGFAIVADKIRKLAEDTSENSKIINEIVEDTASAIDHTVELALKSNRSVEKIVDDTALLADLISTISKANEELDIGRRDILSNIKNLNIITETVQDLSLQQRNMSDEVSESISSVDKLAEDVLHVVNSNENEICMLVDSINNVSSLSTTSSENLGILETKIQKLQTIFLELYKLVTLFKSGKVKEGVEDVVMNKKDKYRK